MENWGRFVSLNSNEYLNQQQCVTAEKFQRTSKTPDIEKQQQYQRR